MTEVEAEPKPTAEVLDDRIVSLAPPGAERARSKAPWILLAAGLTLAVAVGSLYANRLDARLGVLGSPTPIPTAALAIASQEPSPTADANLCAEGAFDVEPSTAAFPSADLGPLRLAKQGSLALAIEEDRSGGSIIVARSRGDEAGTIDASAVARFSGYDIELPRAVTPVAWSTHGDAILVNVGYLSMSERERNCNDLFLVQADGSRVTRLTNNGPGQWANGSAISGVGQQVAYVDGGEIRLAEIAGVRRAGSVGACGQSHGPVRWSADESRLLVVCDNQVVVVDLLGERELHFAAPADTVLMTAGWTPIGQSIVAIAAPARASQLGPLQIVDLDPANGTPSATIQTDVSTDWIVGSSTISPDARWALVQGDGATTPATYHPTFAIDIGTGVATKLPWTVIHDLVEPSSITWLAQPDRFLYVEDQTLYEVDVATMSRTDVGAVPASDYAWYEVP